MEWNYALAGRRQGRPREIHRPGRGGREFQLDHLGGRRGAVTIWNRSIGSGLHEGRDAGKRGCLDGLIVVGGDVNGVFGSNGPLIHDFTIA